MKPDRFTIYIVIRVVIILLLSIVFGFLFAKGEYFFSQIIIASLILVFTFELIFFNKKAVRDLNRFLFAMKHGDMTVNFNDQSLGSVFKDLADSFRQIIHSNSKTQTEREARNKLLQQVIDQIEVGIIALDHKGNFILINEASQHMFAVTASSNWEILSKAFPDFTKETDYMAPNSRKLLEVKKDKNVFQLSVYKNSFKIFNEECDLITFYDIVNEIDQKEIEAWYKLIRILTHEIMNSITPLSSLTDTIIMLLEKEKGVLKNPDQISSQNVADIIKASKTIKNRSSWILNFVDDYRRLTNIPNPDFQEILVSKLIDSVVSLMKDKLESKGIKIRVSIESDLHKFKVDKSLMEMVLINLITNSMYASESIHDPVVNIRSRKVASMQIIEIEDNGKGIPEDRMDKIFIPFYSTREGGSGIGLSLSKQIIHLHHGRIKVNSEKGKTVFTIQLQAV